MVGRVVLEELKKNEQQKNYNETLSQQIFYKYSFATGGQNQKSRNVENCKALLAQKHFLFKKIPDEVAKNIRKTLKIQVVLMALQIKL